MLGLGDSERGRRGAFLGENAFRAKTDLKQAILSGMLRGMQSVGAGKTKLASGIRRSLSLGDVEPGRRGEGGPGAGWSSDNGPGMME